MKIILSAFLLAFVLCFASCSNNKESEGQPETTVAATDSLAPLSPVQISSTDTSVKIMPVTGEKPVFSKDFNPPHGEPGHRCDIAVGAPINSPAGTGMSGGAPSGGPSISNMPMSSGSAPSAPPTTSTPPPSGPTPPGMNPPHGQPGHDCAIEVGAPLKKK